MAFAVVLLTVALQALAARPRILFGQQLTGLFIIAAVGAGALGSASPPSLETLTVVLLALGLGAVAFGGLGYFATLDCKRRLHPM